MLNWWMWIVFGLVLLAGEILTPGGFYVFFLGCSAVLVGFIVLALPDLPVWVPWLLFTLISGILLVFRRPLQERFQRSRQTREVDTMVGEVATALEDIASDRIGKAELRGSSWSARNISDLPVTKSQRCIVDKVEGLMLLVRPE